MRFKKKIAAVLFAGSFWLMTEVPVRARLGESSQTIHKRLRSHSAGNEYHDDIQEVKSRQAPFARMMPMLDEADIRVEVRTWWKKDNQCSMKNADLSNPRCRLGWDQYVVFFKGESVLECYRKNSGGISAYERDALLRLNFAEKNWREYTKPQQDGSYLSFQFESGDGKCRALNVGNNQLMVFYSSFDKQLAELNTLWCEKNDRDARENLVENIEGF